MTRQHKPRRLDKLYSENAAVRFIGVSKTTFRRYAKIGMIRKIRVEGSRSVVYSETDLQVFKSKIDFPTRPFKRLFRPTVPIAAY